MGKGSKRRPRQIKQEEFDKRWELAFGKKEGLTYEEGCWFLNIADIKISLCDKSYE